jgi:hypothetical protein
MVNISEGPNSDVSGPQRHILPYSTSHSGSMKNGAISFSFFYLFFFYCLEAIRLHIAVQFNQIKSVS